MRNERHKPAFTAFLRLAQKRIPTLTEVQIDLLFAMLDAEVDRRVAHALLVLNEERLEER